MSGAALAPIASGQEPALVTRLKAGLTCAEPDAGNQLLRNADDSAADLSALLVALDEISNDTAVCAQINEAAFGLALELSDSNPGQDAVEAKAAAERMKQILAEADQRAASSRFEVGPPPPNLTRSRTAPQ
jgi:hypothetical protein